jgi:hypothetical protein
VLLNETVDEFAGEMVGVGEKQSLCILYPRKTIGNHTNISIASTSSKIRVVALRFLKFQLWLFIISKHKHHCIMCSDLECNSTVLIPL